MTSQAFSGGPTEVPVEQKLIPLEAEAHALTGLTRGRFAFAINDRIVITDAGKGEVTGELLVGSAVVSLAGQIDTAGRQSIVVVTADYDDTNALSLSTFEEASAGSSEFKRTQRIRVPANAQQVAVVGGGRTVVSWSDDRAGNDAGTIFHRFGKITFPLDRPLIAVVPVASMEFALAVREGSVSLLELETGRFVAEIPAKQFASIRSLAAIAPQQQRTSNLYSNLYSPALVVDTLQNLTLLGVNTEPFPEVRVLGHVSIDENGASPIGDLPILVADSALRYILVRPPGGSLIRVFRTIGTGIERAGTMDLGMTVRDATVLLGAGGMGKDAFAFLSSDGRSVLIVPDPIRFGAAPPRDRSTKFDPNAWPSFSDTTTHPSPETLATVRAVQLVLGTLGYKIGVIDGIAGPATRSALKTFQFSNELSVTGDLDEATAQKLTEAAAKTGPEKDLAPLEHYGITPSENTIYLQFAGASREAVEDIVTNLRRSGWNVAGDPERLGNAAGLNEVRYGRSADRDAAEALAEALTRAQFSSKPVIAKFVRIVRPKVLEVWISR
ncbi:peptidoglycan-binding protein [Ensifer sp. NPDC090286]|uniref:peptidoglycan-binding domain-containing protein n=1 Tax=Ensifer sp. NPDC090286 TaxID=3363991 RepID=UPI00383B362B